ncbi:MAG TPA: NADPH-dependent FMN reductase [Trinickia sp.]|uniref:NADPH-dependent FMN reductase n=1 Tax=Trinickia sp. TaxID=2571163 RepID=UPI002CA9D198|nr:NADPH-dependent FMN reductase [Trinickia sp.]HTI18611.1 NADPH-dependent FMN reductase [Trinickia sp.]
MKSVFNIVGIAGSLRAASYSQMILKSIAGLVPAGSTVNSIDIGAIPHYNEDLEREGLPQTVVTARAQVEACDAVVIVTPEFNHGLPGVLKNTLDWLSRPAFTGCMKNKPVFFVTLSPGALGGVRAQYQMRETLASMLCQLVPLPEMAITHVGAKVDDGQLTERATLDFIEGNLQRFLNTVVAGTAGQ